MNRNTKISLAILIITVSLGLVWLSRNGRFSWMYASYLESKWQRTNPQTRTDLEKILHLYSVTSVDPSESEWGARPQPKKNEHILKYLILWDAPVYVVYDQEDAIVRIFPSYD